MGSRKPKRITGRLMKAKVIIPKGWRALRHGELIRANDRVLSWPVWLEILVPGKLIGSTIYAPSHSINPVIRRIKKP
jgi:hypothetical protein